MLDRMVTIPCVPASCKNNDRQRGQGSALPIVCVEPASLRFPVSPGKRIAAAWEIGPGRRGELSGRAGHARAWVPDVEAPSCRPLSRDQSMAEADSIIQ